MCSPWIHSSVLPVQAVFRISGCRFVPHFVGKCAEVSCAPSCPFVSFLFLLLFTSPTPKRQKNMWYFQPGSLILVQLFPELWFLWPALWLGSFRLKWALLELLLFSLSVNKTQVTNWNGWFYRVNTQLQDDSCICISSQFESSGLFIRNSTCSALKTGRMGVEIRIYIFCHLFFLRVCLL